MEVAPLTGMAAGAAVGTAPTAALELRPLNELDGLRDLESVFVRIWSRDGPPPLTADLMRALAHSGNYVVGAYLDDRLVAGLVGFLGRLPGHGLHLHSHILGVVPDMQLRGAGFALKQHQRSWALARGIDEVVWTFDPLVRRNGFFNICKLGAGVEEYHVDFYGSMGDGINGAGASDRAVAVWHLTSERSTRAAAGAPAEVDIDALIADGALIALREAPDGTPLVGHGEGRIVLCQVPADIVALRRERPAVADAWRVALRDTLGRALHDGHVATGMTRSGWYVLGPR